MFRKAGVLIALSCFFVWGCGGGESRRARRTSPSKTPPSKTIAKKTSAKKNGTPASTGWGTLRGRFVYQGDPPEPQFLQTTSKDKVCQMHKIPDETLIVDAKSKGIKNVLIYARRVSRVHPSQESLASPVEFDQRNCIFLHRVLAVRVGQTVTLKNSDPTSHNINIAPPGDTGINPLISAGADPVDHKFSRVQTRPIAVTCNIHPWMRAYILPRKDAYAAVTDKNGGFEIPNLPADEEVEFQVWHEKSSGPKNGLAARPDWGEGRFRVTISAGGVEDLGEIQVPPAAFK